MKRFLTIITLVVLLWAISVFVQAQSPAPPVLYVFTMSGCAACEADKPVVEDIRRFGVVYVATMDREADPDYVREFNVTTYPTYILCYQGQERWRRKTAQAAYDRIMEGNYW